MTLATEFTTSDLALLIIVAVLISIAGYIAMAETALTRMNKVKAMTLAEEQPRRGRALLRLVGHPERFLNPLLLVLLICQLVQATLVGIVSERLFGTLGIVIATIFNVVIVFVFAEAAPKTWALEHPERSALLVARPVSALVAFPPIRGVSKALIGLTNVILPGKGLKKGPFVSEEELLAFADVAVQEDVIEHEERELIESIIDFGDTVAREVMVPRLDMITLPAGMPVSESLDVAIEHGFSRLPVVGNTVDDVKGLAYAKDLMRAEREGRGQDPVSGILRPAQLRARDEASGRAHARDAGRQVPHGAVGRRARWHRRRGDARGPARRARRRHHRRVRHRGCTWVERLDEGGFRVQGSVPIDELNDLLESDIPHDGWDTVGGFVLGELGRVPEPGESLKHRQWTFTVEDIEGRRVGAVRVTEDPDWEPVDDFEER